MANSKSRGRVQGKNTSSAGGAGGGNRVARTRVRVTGGTAKRSQAYDAAGSGRRSDDWRVGSTGPSKVISDNLETLRNRSRHEVRTHAFAGAIVDTIQTDVVGSGIRPLVDDEDLMRRWNRWVEHADARGVVDFYGLQGLVVREMAEAGEILSRVRARRPSDGVPLNFQIELVEPELLPVSQLTEIGNRDIRYGIEFDKIGRRKAYYLLREHPGESLLGSTSLTDTRPVPADQVQHIFNPVRAGQDRGVPWLARTLVVLHNLDAYLDAEMARKYTTSLHVGVIKSNGADEDAVEEVYGDEAGTQADPDDEAHIPPLSPGGIINLPPGYEMVFNGPADVGGHFREFVVTQLRAACSAVGVPYECVMSDVTDINDRTLRGILIAYRRRVAEWQRLLVTQFLNPVWKEFVKRAEIDGWRPASGSVEDYYTPRWMPEAFRHIHPTQEIEAYTGAYDLGIMSRAEIAMELGRDITEIDAQRRVDRDRARDLNLPASPAESKDPEKWLSALNAEGRRNNQ